MENQYSLPHFKSSNITPLSLIEKKIIESQVAIETWFRKSFYDKPIMITSSVDIRNAGFKISPVDTNLFPAGFNNLNPESYSLAIQALQFTIGKINQNCQKILLIPESHTRNRHYFESVSILLNLITKAGFDVKVGSLLDIEKPITIQVGDKESFELFPLVLNENTITIDKFNPCMILLNNDLSEGIPDILSKSKQVIVPPPQLGWHRRLKSSHFSFFSKVAEEFSELIGIDPWQIDPFFEDCGEIDFLERTGEECLIDKANILFEKIQKKYLENNIKRKPFVVVKSNQGTYGMAVMMIQDPNDIKNLNRKQRQKMSKTKGGKLVNRVFIQEGVPTNETVSSNAVAEPVVYMIGNSVIGGFYRVHTKKGPEENLNSPGMYFESLAFDECCNNPDARISPHAAQNKFYVYSVIARLAQLAACYEMLEANK